MIMIYLSIAGTQSLAVLNPLLSLLKQGKRPERAVFLATERSENTANSIKKFLIASHGFNDNTVEIIPISDSLESVGDRKPAQEVVKELENEEVFFNLAGGMNFQITACAFTVNLDNSAFMYPDSECVHLIKIGQGGLSHEKLALPDPVDVLKLQGVKFEKCREERHKFLSFILGECKIQLPEGTQEHIKIGDVVFDCVSNKGNNLKFLKVIHKSKGDKRLDNYFLNEARKVIALANSREDFGELFHREILVLTNHKIVEEHINREGQGKVTAEFLAEEKFLPYTCAHMKQFFYGTPAYSYIRGRHVTENTGVNKIGNSTLFVTLGEDILPGLIALWSHKPAKVCFLYTPDNEHILAFKNSILANKNLLPVREVSFYPVSLLGYEIFDFPISDENIEVNVTSGTKAQGFFLSLFAREKNGEVYSLNTRTQRVEQIFPESGETKGSLQAPAPVMFLKLKGEDVLEYGVDKGALMKEKNLYENLRISIRNKGGGGVNGRRFPEGGEWFEKFIGYIMAECGANDVQVRVRTKWSEGTRRYLEEKYKREVLHRTDMDVIARFNSNYYIIECKSQKKIGNTKVIADKMKADAPLFGRFTIPLIAHLHHKGEPQNINGVYVFGPETFTNYDAMRSLLEKALTEKKTTR